MVTRRDVVRLALALPLIGFTRTAAAQEHDRFYVFGLVKNPGAYHFKNGMTVDDALTAAGGVRTDRQVSTVEIIRVVDGEKQTATVLLNDPVLPNDSIVVR